MNSLAFRFTPHSELKFERISISQYGQVSIRLLQYIVLFFKKNSCLIYPETILPFIVLSTSLYFLSLVVSQLATNLMFSKNDPVKN